MPAVIALIISFIVGFLFSVRSKRFFVAWILSCLVMPAFVLFAEFVLPYMVGGASFWPIALVIGSVLGAMTGGLGIAVAVYYLDWRSKKSNDNLTTTKPNKPLERDAQKR